MKRVLISLIALSAVVVTAQEKVEQSGTPAMLEAANGKKLKVFLQNLEGDMLTFQPFKSPKNMSVPASKITSLQFFPKYDEEAVNASFISGDFEGALEVLEPLLTDFIEYMPIENNMRKSFVLAYNCYRFSGDFENAEKYAQTLIECGNDDLVLKGKAGLALVAIQKNDLETAEKIGLELAESSEAAGLYMKAAVQRAKGDPKGAVQTVTIIIEEHANDLEWMPPSELLVAYCYLDMTGSNSVITTNSALNTARQVKNIYAGSAVAVDAQKLWADLGGAEIEAKRLEEKAAQEIIMKEAKAKREADAKARKEAAAAKKAADKAAAKQSGVSTNTVTGTESE